jgi:hypothetical protein
MVREREEPLSTFSPTGTSFTALMEPLAELHP